MALILHASDLHFGAEDRAALDWFTAEAHHRKPDAIVITGDLTMRARKREFDAARSWLAALPAPVSVEAGNHDLPYFDIYARLFTPYRRYHAVERFIERPMSLADVAIVPLRTTARAQWRLNWSKGTVRQRRIERAREMLVRSQARHRIVTCHHPLVGSEHVKNGHTRNGRVALDALVEAGATAILSGHVHDPFDREVAVGSRSVRLIGAGTLSERIRHNPPSFNAISLTVDGLDVEAVFAT